MADDINHKSADLDLDDRKFTINFGPQHPAAHGVLRLVLGDGAVEAMDDAARNTLVAQAQKLVAEERHSEALRVWLKIGLLGKSLIELLRHMDTHGYDTVVPHAPVGVGTRSMLDLNSGYMQRSKDDLPRQGDAMPWKMENVFLDDRKMYRGSVIDKNLRFSSRLEREFGGRAIVEEARS